MNSRTPKNAMKDRVADLQQAAEAWSPQQLLQWGFETFGQRVAISSAFGPQGMVVIDMAAKLRGTDFRLFTLDTEFLFPATYNLMEKIEERYGIAIERVYPALSPEEQERIHGGELWERDPNRCCHLRKVEPLRQKLSELDAWITNIRRDQTMERAGARKLEWDAKFGLVKINPVADWTAQEIWSYVRAHHVPYNSLHDRGYPSIGCTHCTRSVNPGEDERAGRWAGFAKNECGLHIIQIEGAPSSSC